MNYPHTPGFQSGSATSREAARTFTGQKDWQEFVLHELRKAGPDGLTSDAALPAALELDSKVDISTIRARFTELHNAGKIIKTALEGKTRHNRPASIYVLPEFHAERMGRISPGTKKKPRHAATITPAHAAVPNPGRIARLENMATLLYQCAKRYTPKERGGFAGFSITPLEMLEIDNLAEELGIDQKPAGR